MIDDTELSSAVNLHPMQVRYQAALHSDGGFPSVPPPCGQAQIGRNENGCAISGQRVPEKSRTGVLGLFRRGSGSSTR